MNLYASLRTFSFHRRESTDARIVSLAMSFPDGCSTACVFLKRAMQLLESPLLLVRSPAPAASLLISSICVAQSRFVRPRASLNLLRPAAAQLAVVIYLLSVATSSLSALSSVFRRSCSSQTSARRALGEAVSVSLTRPSQSPPV